MTDFDCCQRCHLPLAETRFSFQVEAEPPIPNAVPVKVWLCARCLESMQRWMERSHRRGESRPSPEIVSSEDPPRSVRRARRRRRHGPRESSRSAGAARGGDVALHPFALLGIAALVVISATVFVLVVANFTAHVSSSPGS